LNNYQIVTDEAELQKFIEFLPDLGPEETFYLCLFARNKYCKDVKHISSDKAQLKRFVSNKDRMFNKIKQLEVEVGQYYQYRNNSKVEIPQEALALYINPNPRSMKKAIIPSITNLLKIYDTATEGYNIIQEVLSQVQKSVGTKFFYNVDFDVDKSRFKEINEIVSNLELKGTWVETRGGYHYLVDLKNNILNNKWYQELSLIDGIELLSDSMLPVPGTYQGGFTPKII
jgi:hypothetical protein